MPCQEMYLLSDVTTTMPPHEMRRILRMSRGLSSTASMHVLTINQQ